MLVRSIFFRNLRKTPCIILILLAFLPACLHTNQDYLDQELKPWIGNHPDKLVELWGAPQSSYLMDDGRKVLTYQEVSISSRTMTSGYFMHPELYSFSDSCKISLFTDPQQKEIASYHFSGNLSICFDMLEALSDATPKP